MQAEYLFVYGTLRKNGGSKWHTVLASGAEYLGEAYFQGRLFNVQAYPGLIESPLPEDRVLGEIYRLPARKASEIDVLELLDDYEECSASFPEPHEYKRVQAFVTQVDGQTMLAWIYLYTRDVSNLQHIESGDYLAFLEKTKVNPAKQSTG